MPLNYASLEQVSGWRFLWHRLSVAVGRRSVSLVFDPSRNTAAAYLVGGVIAVIALVIALVMSIIKPVGQIGTSRILADRNSSGLYVEVGGVMHPALNLASARLIVGQPDNPKMVPGSEIRKLPIGPLVGINGAPDNLEVRTPAATGWALCDRLKSMGSQVVPGVTVISGVGELGDWARTMNSPDAALMSYGGQTFVVTNGHRSAIDLADKAVTLALGLPVGQLRPAPMSRALYEALVPTAPLRVPDIPNPGGPVGYSTAAVPVVSGSVVRVNNVAGDSQFFVALPAGLQLVPETVATIIRNAGLANSGRVVDAESAAVATLPQASGFDVSMYPPGEVRLADKETESVTCVMWRKDAGEPQARVSTVSGRRLPIPVGDEARVISLVSAGSDTADAVYTGRDATNFVQVTGVEPDSPRSESLWWISDNGVRFGVQTSGQADANTRKALGLEGPPTPAPWAVIRWLPAGPVLSHSAAMVQHDALAPDSARAPLPTKSEEG